MALPDASQALAASDIAGWVMIVGTLPNVRYYDVAIPDVRASAKRRPTGSTRYRWITTRVLPASLQRHLFTVWGPTTRASGPTGW